MNTASIRNNASLISPLMDSLMIGGASLIVFALYWLFVDQNASTLNVSLTAFCLTFLVNSPHFMASYQLLYGDYRHLILKKPSFIWAAFVAPILILLTLSVAVHMAQTQILAFMIQAMYLSVGWHYVKQTFGVAIVASAVQKRYFDKWERVFILMNLYSVWAMSWVSANLQGAKSESDGVIFYSLRLPHYFMTLAYALTVITLALTIAMGIRKYIKTGVVPATASLVAFVTIYCWYLPVLSHPSFFFLIPFFHSLQYLLFVIPMKHNESKAVAVKQENPEQQRFLFIKKFGGFIALAIFTGYLSFELLPKLLDKHLPLEPQLFGPTYWLFAFSIFINLHHYFIDNVIWRGDNEFLRTHLVVASQKRAQP